MTTTVSFSKSQASSVEPYNLHSYLTPLEQYLVLYVSLKFTSKKCLLLAAGFSLGVAYDY